MTEVLATIEREIEAVCEQLARDAFDIQLQMKLAKLEADREAVAELIN